MFCDLVGSTALSARLDPEDLRDVFAAYQRRATAVVEAAGGRVARYEGDGVLAYFGYPAAAEDDAERAVRAALELAQGIRIDSLGETLGVRIGIATGVVVVGELLSSGAADNPPVVGETPNLAARLQALAGPGTVAIAETTRRLVGSLFEYRDCGERRLQGFAEPVHVWHVVRPRVTSRFRALRSQALPLLGRDATVQALLGAWALAEAGSGRVALISGEPGIGKSRLVAELAARIRRQHAPVLRFQCSPRHASSVLHPLLERLARVARQRRAGSAPGSERERLKALVQGKEVAPDAAVALLAELMALPAAAPQQAPMEAPMQAPRPDAQRKRDLLLDALVGNLQRIARERPLLLVVEDAHWIDPTSAQLLELIVRSMAGWAMLLIVTCRPELEPAWRGEAHVTCIELRPIVSADAEALVRSIPGADRLSQAVVRGIAARADGVPLYVEELTKSVVESAASTATPRIGRDASPVIPANLHASLMARLDRIGTTREIASIAAALGREFNLGLLSAVVPHLHPGALRRELQTLVDAELIHPVAASLPETYAFRHALIQDVAYGTLLRRERRTLHERIARAIEERFPEIVATEPEIVADHFAKAELWVPAIRHRLSAGHRAVRSWALLEAAKHFSEGIRIAGLMPQSAERQRLELDLLIALGPVTMGIKGYPSQESLDVYQRAETLVTAIGDVSERLMVMFGLFNVHYGRAELAEALCVAQGYCALAERHGAHLGRAYGLLAQTHAAMGAIGEAHREFRRSLDVCERQPEDVSTLGVFASQHVISLALGGGVDFALGNPEAGRAAIAQSIALARRIEHALSIALALVTDLLTPIPGGLDPDQAQAEEVVRFCRQHGLRNFEVWAQFALGAIMARRGDVGAGTAAMRAAIDAAEAFSSRLFRPIQLGTLAAIYARLGESKTAMALLDQALATSARTGERRADPALQRMRGELLLALGKHAAGTRELEQALAVARSQQAKVEEARIEGVLKLVRGGPLAAVRALLAWRTS
jgi:class 3 adenylate cyclase/tetratricopeptide (TPR) repeat protein